MCDERLTYIVLLPWLEAEEPCLSEGARTPLLLTTRLMAIFVIVVERKVSILESIENKADSRRTLDPELP
jgi:hypothetical protein